MTRLRGTAFIMAANIALLCSFPQQAMGLDHSDIAKNLIQTSRVSTPFLLIEQMTKIGNELEKSEDPLEDSRNFFQALIDELNVEQGTNLTFNEVCQSIRTWLASYPLINSRYVHALDLLENPALPRQQVSLRAFTNQFLLWSDWKFYDIILFLMCCLAGGAIVYYSPESSTAVITALGAIATTILTTTPQRSTCEH